jgi:ABC-2 type transport system permease protein
MNIFAFEFRRYVGSLAVWVGSIIALLVMFMAFYPVLAQDAATLDLVLAHYPEELLKAFGMGGQLSLATVAGFFAFSFAFAQLVIAAQSAYYGFHFVSAEERERTADFLYTKPISRESILAAKYGAAGLALLLTNLGVWAGSFLAIYLFRGEATFELWPVVSLLLTVPIFQLFFLSLGFLVTAVSKKTASVIGPAVAVSFVLYMLNALRRIVGGELLGLISPYYHFDPNYILVAGQWDVLHTAVSLAFILAANVVAVRLYLKRDLSTAI